MSNYWIFWIVIWLCCIVPLLRSNQLHALHIIRKNKKGEKRSMPQELIKEFIGKVCAFSLFNESFAVTGKLVEVENNWIKVEEKDSVRLINGDMIRDIKIMPAKYQK